MAKIAINGLGRIGRAALKIIMEKPELELVAVNDIAPADNLAYLLKYDTVYGRYHYEVGSDENHLIVDGRKFRVYSQKDPAQLPWRELGVDIVLECTGVFTRMADLKKHIEAGARYVLLSAPPKEEGLGMVVYGVSLPDINERILSCASCTTNSISPVMEIMDRRIGVKKALMTTVHAYTSSQSIVDGPSKKYRRGRAGAANFVPTTTGAAVATTKALPGLEGKFDGVAIRGPVPTGSLADIVFVAGRNTTVEEVNRIFTEEAQSDRYREVMRVNNDEIVSSDIIQDPHAAIVDLTMTQVVDGDLVKVMSWYDNEWGFTNQMIRSALKIADNLKKHADVSVP